MPRGLLVTIIVGLATLASAQTARPTQTFMGVITDSECSMADHRQMQMGDTDAECVKACIEAHGATYVLFDGKTVYNLSDQTTPEKFAAKKVKVVGVLGAKSTIQVQSITAG